MTCVATLICPKCERDSGPRLVIFHAEKLNRRSEATKGRMRSRNRGLIEVHNHPIRIKAYQTEKAIRVPP